MQVLTTGALAPQVDDRSPQSPGYLDVGLGLYRLDRAAGAQSTLTLVACTEGSAVRNVLLEAYLAAGEYVLVPLTGGVRATPSEAMGASTPADPYMPEPGCPLSATVCCCGATRARASHKVFTSECRSTGNLSLVPDSQESLDQWPLCCAVCTGVQLHAAGTLRSRPRHGWQAWP